MGVVRAVHWKCVCNIYSPEGGFSVGGGLIERQDIFCLVLTALRLADRGHVVRSGQVWGHTPEQRVAASTWRRFSLGLRLVIAQADARPAMPVSFR